MLVYLAQIMFSLYQQHFSIQDESYDKWLFFDCHINPVCFLSPSLRSVHCGSDKQTHPCSLWPVTCGLLTRPQTGPHSRKQTKHNTHRGHIICACTHANVQFEYFHLCWEEQTVWHTAIIFSQKKEFTSDTPLPSYLIYMNSFTFLLSVLELSFGVCSCLLHLLKDRKVWKVKYSRKQYRGNIWYFY